MFALAYSYAPSLQERRVESKVENLCLVELGDELVAEADFQDQRISVRCAYDTARRCWVYHVFLIDGSGLRRISVFPSDLFSATRMGAVHRGLRFAKFCILGVVLPPSVPVDEFRIWKDSSEEIDEEA